jgi:hypothetical protein
MSDDARLNLLDITLREFEELYYTNEKLFRSVNNWFYFANDKKVSPLSEKGYVCYGRNRNRSRSFGFPEDTHGGLFLVCTSDADTNAIKAKCAEEKNNIMRFELDDGTPAHYAILKDTVGAIGPKDKEYPVLIVPNKPQTKTWPYSLQNNTTFDKASKEEGTITHYAVSREIEGSLPDWVRNDLCI